MSKAMDALDLIYLTDKARHLCSDKSKCAGCGEPHKAFSTLRDYITTTEAERAKGVLAVEIDRGVEGLSLSIMSYENDKKDSGVGERLDGPKAWGGGHALYSCTVDKVMAEQILEEIYRTYPDARPKRDCRPQAPGRDESAARIKELEEALNGLKTGDCFCGCGIDNPMMGGRHSDACQLATTALSGARKVNSLGSVRGDEHSGAMLPDEALADPRKTEL